MTSFADVYLVLQTNSLNEIVCKGCDTLCNGCEFEGGEPLCSEELDHSSAAGGNATLEFLSIESGYWRATTTSIDVLAC